MEREKILSNLIDNYQVQRIKTKEQAWAGLQHKLEIKQQKVHASRLGWSFWASSAAAIVLALIIVYSRIEKDETIKQELATQVEETSSMVLPDNSSITLAPNSSLHVAYNAKKSERKIELKGEAYFKVEKGGNFEVDFRGGLVSVLGTEFSVSAYDSTFFQINCTQGLVKVTVGQDSRLLHQGQGIKFHNGVLTGPFTIDQEKAREQENGIYYWNKISLNELMSLIGSRFNYKVELADELKERNFSGRIELNKLEECLEIVSLAMNVDFTRDINSRTIQFHEK